MGLSTYLASSYFEKKKLVNSSSFFVFLQAQVIAMMEHTEPPIGPSWADFPLTVNVTPLGALDLTSMLAIKKLVSHWKNVIYNSRILPQNIPGLVW
jgi:hypothetical protein